MLRDTIIAANEQAEYFPDYLLVLEETRTAHTIYAGEKPWALHK